LTIWFLHFSLPWQGLQAATRMQKYEKICETKLNTPIEVCGSCFRLLRTPSGIKHKWKVHLFGLKMFSGYEFLVLRYFASHVPSSLLLTFIIAAPWHLINDQIMDIWSACFVNCSLLKVITVCYQSVSNNLFKMAIYMLVDYFHYSIFFALYSLSKA